MCSLCCYYWQGQMCGAEGDANGWIPSRILKLTTIHRALARSPSFSLSYTSTIYLSLPLPLWLIRLASFHTFFSLHQNHILHLHPFVSTLQYLSLSYLTALSFLLPFPTFLSTPSFPLSLFISFLLTSPRQLLFFSLICRQYFSLPCTYYKSISNCLSSLSPLILSKESEKREMKRIN